MEKSKGILMHIVEVVKKEGEKKEKKIRDSLEDSFIEMIRHREKFLDEKINQEYKKLKTFLIKGYQGYKTLLIVSSLPGEGTTSVAIQFAKELSGENGKKVILIDANLRNPSLFTKLSISQQHGLADILKDTTFSKAKKMVRSTTASDSRNIDVFMKEAEGAFEEIVTRYIQTTDSKNLLAISSGITTDENILSSENENISHLIKYLKKEYDYILFDGAPAHLYSDSLIIAPYVDGVVLVVEAESTKREIIIKVKKEIENIDGKIIGIVLNKQRYYIPERIYKFI